MEYIRQASDADLARIAEMEVFNYRLNFYPIFRCDAFYFGELQVPSLADEYRHVVGSLWVYDDGTVKGFIRIEHQEIHKLFVEPVLQGRGIGTALLEFAVRECGANALWALQKNTGAIRFYERHGFRLTGERKLVEDTAEYLVRLER